VAQAAIRADREGPAGPPPIPPGINALVVDALPELDAEHHREIDALRSQNARLQDRLDALEHALRQRTGEK
jgi:hypothetical protein